MAQNEWVQLETTNGKPYFWKETTGETSWTWPSGVQSDVKIPKLEQDIKLDDEALVNPWQKVKSTNGEVYWWNVMTDETCRELSQLQWEAKEVDTERERERERERMKLVGAQAGVRVVTGEKLQEEFGLGSYSNSSKSNTAVKGSIWSKRPASADNESLTSVASATSGESTSKSIRGRLFGAMRHSKEEAAKSGRSRRSCKEDSSLEHQIKDKLKKSKGKLKAEDVVRSMEIGAPFDVSHPVHVRFDQDNVRFSGLPSDWDLGHQQQFGVSLQSCPRMEVEGYPDRIPAVLVLLKRALLDLGGLAVEGIFRIAPDGVQCDEVKRKINSCQGFEALRDCLDPNIPANLIKLFFRELKPTLLLNCLSTEEMTSFCEDAEDSQLLAGRVARLPEPHRSILLWLLDLLALVVANKEVNRMSEKNVAIILSPNLFEAVGAPTMQIVALAQKIAVLIEKLLLWRIATSNPKAQKLCDDDSEVFAIQHQQQAATVAPPTPERPVACNVAVTDGDTCTDSGSDTDRQGEETPPLSPKPLQEATATANGGGYNNNGASDGADNGADDGLALLPSQTGACDTSACATTPFQGDTRASAKVRGMAQEI